MVSLWSRVNILCTIKTLRGGHTRYQPVSRVTRHTAWHCSVVTWSALGSCSLDWFIISSETQLFGTQRKIVFVPRVIQPVGGHIHHSVHTAARNGISAGISSAEKLAMHTTQRAVKIIAAPRAHVSSPPRRHEGIYTASTGKIARK